MPIPLHNMAIYMFTKPVGAFLEIYIQTTETIFATLCLIFEENKPCLALADGPNPANYNFLFVKNVFLMLD